MKTKTKLIPISFIVIAILTFILIYNYQSKNESEIYLKNGGFNRYKKHYTLKKIYSSPMDDAIYGISFVSKSGDVFIRNYKTSVFDILKKNGDRKEYRFPQGIMSKDIFEITNSGDSIADLTLKNVQKIVSISLKDFKKISEYNLGRYFKKVIRVDNKTFFGISSVGESDSLVFSNIYFDKIGGNKIKTSNVFLKSGMSEDGYLVNEGLDYFFIHAFNNVINKVSFDLKTVNLFKTIDTITESPKVIKIKKGDITYLKYGSPPRLSNRSAVSTNNNLFIFSIVGSDRLKEDQENDIIDIYSGLNGKYKGSLYFPVVDGQRLQQFYINNNYIALQYQKKLDFYEITY